MEEEQILECVDGIIKTRNGFLFTDQQISIFVKLYEEGKSLKQIGDIYGISESTVTKKIKNLVNIRKSYIEKPIDDIMLLKCIELYEKGKTFKQIGDMFGVSDVHMAKKIRNFIQIRPSGGRSTFSEEQISKCVEFYEEGKTIEELAKIFDKSPSGISKILRTKIQLRTNIKNNSHVENDVVISLYLDGNSTRKISRILDCSELYVKEILKKENIHIRTFYENKKDKTLNHDFFKTFDEKSSYWAGFIAADGNVLDIAKSKTYRLSIKLSIKDILHLNKFKKSINSSRDVGIQKKMSFGKICVYSNLALYSKYLLDDLFENFNICPKKSLILDPPYGMLEKYVSHFIRGYLDGDGCIANNIKKKGISFIGTKQMLEWIKEKIKENCKDAKNPNVIKRKKDNIYYLTFAGNKQTTPILNWLYQGANEEIWLDRKHDIYLKYLKSYKENL